MTLVRPARARRRRRPEVLRGGAWRGKRGRRARRRRRRDLRRDGHSRWRLAQRGRIEQDGVVAHDAAGRPGGLEDQVDERVVDDGIAVDAQHRPPVGPPLQLDPHVAQGGAVVEPGRAEGFGRGNLGAQRVGLGVAQFGQFDLGTERLAQRGKHGDAAQRQRQGFTRRPSQRGRHGERRGGCLPSRQRCRQTRCGWGWIDRHILFHHSGGRLDTKSEKVP